MVAVRANLKARDAKNQEAAAAAALVRAAASKPNNIPAAAIIGGTALAGALYLGLGSFTTVSPPVPPTAIQVDTPQAVVAAPKPETTKMKGAVGPATKQPETKQPTVVVVENPVATPPPTTKRVATKNQQDGTTQKVPATTDSPNLSKYQGPAAGAALAYGLYYASTNREDPDGKDDTKNENDTSSSENEDTSDRTTEEQDSEDDDDNDDDAASDTNDEEDKNAMKTDDGK